MVSSWLVEKDLIEHTCQPQSGYLDILSHENHAG